MRTNDPLAHRVVAVTGASSGIGRETALVLAARGARVALVARRADTLRAIADECERRGGRAIAIPTDVADPVAVDEAVGATLRAFGRIDAWVNNAAVLSAGRFLDTPPDVFRRVIETNLFGYVNGARAALPVFLEQGGGVLVNNASVLGTVGVPFMSAYVASKFAIRGLSETLRQEMLHEPVEVCAVLPATIATPIWSHAANFTGRQLIPVPPVFKASQVAQAIVGCIERPRPEVVVGWSGWVMRMGHLAPRVVYDFLAERFAHLALGSASAERTVGNIFRGMGAGRVAREVIRLQEHALERIGVGRANEVTR